MTETVRDRIWVAALAVARVHSTFKTSDVLGKADASEDHRPTAVDVLQTMQNYGFLKRVEDGEEWRADRTVPMTDVTPSGFDGSFTYLSAPITRWTFASDDVREWIESRLEGRVLNLFAGATRLRHDGGEIIRNDLNEEIDADYHVDANRIADHFEPGSFDTVVLDPPRSEWNATGDSGPGRLGGISRIKNQTVKLVSVGGRTITVGRSSSGMGSTRGFEKEEICLVNHPGAFTDTIAVVERRTREIA